MGPVARRGFGTKVPGPPAGRLVSTEHVTEIYEQDQQPTPDDGRPDVVMQVFGFFVAIALVIIAGTFVFDSIRDIF